MRFPRQAAPDGAHADAHRRSDEARDHEREMHDAHRASKDTPAEAAAATDLAAATEKTGARQAWLDWAKRDD